MQADATLFGGGSGGDTGMTDPGNQVKSAKHTYQIGGNQVVLVSRKPLSDPDPEVPAPDPSRIVLLAGGSLTGGFIDEGEVDIRGCKCVRITSGPLAIPVLSPATSLDGGDGVDIIVSQDQSITLLRGLAPEINQSITLAPNSITINGGQAGTITLQCGENGITIGPTGITIIGLPNVMINPGPPDPPLPPLPPGQEYA